MCVLSATIDTWKEHWQPFAPTVYPDTQPLIDMVQREQLKKELEEFRRILKKAREWDKTHQVEDCVETPQKIEALMEIVRALGLEEEVEIVLKEVTDDNADIQVGGSTTTSVRVGGYATGGNVSVDGSTTT